MAIRAGAPSVVSSAHYFNEFEPASNDREAFKDESRRLDSHGGPDSSANHNKIESPGKKYRDQDGSK